jgi:glycosyltransferase involved in cell wall biosynthesis
VSEKLTIVGIYAWPGFWAIDEDKGSPSFYLSPKGFVNAGHRMVIVMPRGDASSGPGSYRGIELERYRGAPSTIRENPLQGKLLRTIRRNVVYWQYVIASLVAGFRVCRRVRPDAIVAYGDYSVIPAWLLARRFRVPNVTRIFGTNLNRYLGKSLWLLYHYIHVLPFKVPADYVILANDGSEGDRVARALGVPAERLRFWRNGGDHASVARDVDVPALRAERELPATGPLLVTISRLHPEKHIERILAALPTAGSRHPDLRLVIVGAGPDEARLRAEAARLGVEDRVVWTGALSREDLVRCVGACDLFVAMSDRTNAANPLFEAMLCGKPGVVLDTGDTAKVVTDGENGWLVPETHPERLGEILAGVLDDTGAIARAGASARAWAVANIPTYEERQRMEVEIVEQAVREHRGRTGETIAQRRPS